MPEKLFDIIGGTSTLTPEQTAAKKWAASALGLRQNVQRFVTMLVTDSAALGKANIFAQMPPGVADQFNAALPLLQALWEGTTSVEFPAIPDQPVVEEGQ